MFVHSAIESLMKVVDLFDLVNLPLTLHLHHHRVHLVANARTQRVVLIIRFLSLQRVSQVGIYFLRVIKDH